MDKKVVIREKRLCEQCNKVTVQDVTYLCMVIGGKEEGRMAIELTCPECEERYRKEAIERTGIKFLN